MGSPSCESEGKPYIIKPEIFTLLKPEIIMLL